MEDIRLEKMVEVIYQQLLASVPSSARKSCPALKRMGEIILDIKEASNSEIAAELGIVTCKKGACPCQSKRGGREIIFHEAVCYSGETCLTPI